MILAGMPPRLVMNITSGFFWSALVTNGEKSAVVLLKGTVSTRSMPYWPTVFATIFPPSGGKIVANTVGQYGIDLVDTVPFSKTTADFSPFVTKALQKKPDVMFITSLGGIPAKI